MDADVIDNGACVAIRLSGRFDASGQKAFIHAVDLAMAAAGGDVEIDFDGVDYIDSTALGLLLILRERAKHAGKAVSLVGAKNSVKTILDIAKFDKIFSMK